jgi:hypothetical protein
MLVVLIVKNFKFFTIRTLHIASPKREATIERLFSKISKKFDECPTFLHSDIFWYNLLGKKLHLRV